MASSNDSLSVSEETLPAAAATVDADDERVRVECEKKASELLKAIGSIPKLPDARMLSATRAYSEYINVASFATECSTRLSAHQASPELRDGLVVLKFADSVENAWKAPFAVEYYSQASFVAGHFTKPHTTTRQSVVTDGKLFAVGQMVTSVCVIVPKYDLTDPSKDDEKRKEAAQRLHAKFGAKTPLLAADDSDAPQNRRPLASTTASRADRAIKQPNARHIDPEVYVDADADAAHSKGRAEEQLSAADAQAIGVAEADAAAKGDDNRSLAQAAAEASPARRLLPAQAPTTTTPASALRKNRIPRDGPRAATTAVAAAHTF